MNPHEFHQMYKQLVRPSREKVVAAAKKELGIPQEVKINNGAEILDWINYNQKAYGDNKLPMTPEERKTGERIEKTIYDTPVKEIERFNDKILKRGKYEVKPKKKVVSLDKPQKPLPFNLDRWLDEIDPQWWILPEDPTPDPKEEARLRLKKLKFEEILRKVEEAKIAKGLKALMHLNRGQV